MFDIFDPNSDPSDSMFIEAHFTVTNGSSCLSDSR